MDINNWLRDNHDRLIKIRRQIHSHPEIGFKEFKTSKYLKNILTDSFYSITQKSVMQTGFFVEYGKKNNSILAIRCDLDGLPIQEKNNIEYSSKLDGYMHACGHDVHMTIATGIALFFKENNIDIPGLVRFIYQPAEESAPGGAMAMIKGGAVKNVNHIIGYHVFPKLEGSQIGIKDRYVCAAVEAHTFTFNGRGGHTSRPEETEDMISIVSEFINTINFSLHNLKKEEHLVLTFGHINAGDTFNVIPDELILKGTFRYLNKSDKVKVYDIINRFIEKFSNKYNIKINHEVPYACPAIINDVELTKVIYKSAVDAIGKNNVIDLKKPSMGGEDFSFYLGSCPGAYIRIGSNDGKTKDLHTPNFNVDEECIFSGIRVITESILNYFKLI